MISVICAYNNLSILDSMLKKSLLRQKNAKYELIAVDTKKEHLNSASQALNFGFEKSIGDILVFCHQDIEFISDNALSLIETYCKTNDFGIAGVAGKSNEEQNCRTSVIMGKTKVPGGKLLTTKVCETSTLDECLFIIKREKFSKFTDYGKTWHLYAVDYSLKSKINGEKVLLFPIKIYHLSPGWSMDSSYYKTLKLLGHKYKKEVKYISTTCGSVKNDLFLPLTCKYRTFKYYVKKKLGLDKNSNL